MKYLGYKVLTGEENMNTDSNILESAIKNNSTDEFFRFYGWAPKCVSLGKNQSDEFINKQLLDSLNIDYVRRQTGGRALFHSNELTYCYVAPVSLIPNGENVTKSYKYISQILINIFKSLGVELTIGGCARHISKSNYCMSISTGADLCRNNRKFIGSAQFRKNGYALQHGSILFDYDKELISKIFNEPAEFDSIVTLKEINPNLTVNDIISAFKQLYL